MSEAGHTTVEIRKFKNPKSDAERARTYRLRKKGILPPVARHVDVNLQVTRSVTRPNVARGTASRITPPSHVTALQPAPHHVTKPRKVISLFVTDPRVTLAYAAALSVAGISLFMSVTGLTAIFGGAPTVVMAMGVTFGLWEVAAVMLLGRPGLGWKSRVATWIFVIGFVILNSIGVYGYLCHAHLVHAAAYKATADTQAAELAGQIQTQADRLEDLGKRINQIDAVVDDQIGRHLTVTAKASMAAWDGQRSALASEKLSAMQELTRLKTLQTAALGQQSVFAAENGPVAYLAARVQIPVDAIMPWFILGVSFLLDPAAVWLLLLAARLSAKISP